MASSVDIHVFAKLVGLTVAEVENLHRKKVIVTGENGDINLTNISEYCTWLRKEMNDWKSKYDAKTLSAQEAEILKTKATTMKWKF